MGKACFEGRKSENNLSMLLRSFTLVTDNNIQWHRKRMWIKQQQIFAVQAKFNAFALGQKKHLTVPSKHEKLYPKENVLSKCFALL